MKRKWMALVLMLTLLLTGCSSEKEAERVEIVSPSSALYVTDEADVLSADTEDYIVDRVLRLKQACGGEIAVVTIDFLTNGLDSEEYAYEIINQWGVGDADENNGTVLLLVPGQGKGWITTGSGIEDELTAGKLESILNTYLWDDFDAGDYDTATINTVNEVLAWYENYYNVDLDSYPGAASSADAGGFGGGTSSYVGAAAVVATGAILLVTKVIRILVAILTVVVIVVIVVSIFGGPRGGHGGGTHFFFFGGPRRHRHRDPRPPMGGGPRPGGHPGGGPRPGGGSRPGGHSGGGRPGGSGGFGGGGGRGGGAGRR